MLVGHINVSVIRYYDHHISDETIEDICFRQLVHTSLIFSAFRLAIGDMQIISRYLPAKDFTITQSNDLVKTQFPCRKTFHLHTEMIFGNGPHLEATPRLYLCPLVC